MLEARTEKPRSTQMNVRIDIETKRKGNEALAAIGYSPSAAVRAIWEKAAAHRTDTAFLRQLLEDEAAETPKELEDQLRRRAVVEKGLRIIPEAYERLGITPALDPFFATADWKDIRDRLYDEEFEEERQ